MKITILDRSIVKYNGRYLTAFQTYSDIDDTTAKQLIESGNAKLADDKIAAVSASTEEAAPKTPKFDVKKNGGYVAEAVISPEKKAKLEEEGKLNDPNPVIGKDNTIKKDETPEPIEKVKVYGEDGHELTEDEIKAKEAAARSGHQESNKLPSAEELAKQGQEINK